MDARPSKFEPTPPPAPRAETEHACAILTELADLGLEFARTLHQQAKTAPPGCLPDLAAAFERVSLATRRAILMRQHIRENTLVKERQREVARARILREVDDAIVRAKPDPAEAAPLRAELLDRLDAPELLDHIDTRPVEDVIAEIRRDLGLRNQPGAPAWPRRTPADIEALYAKAAETRDWPPAAPRREPLFSAAALATQLREN